MKLEQIQKAFPAQAEVVLDSLGDARERSVAASTAAGQVREVTLRVRLRFRAATPQGRLLLPPADLLLTRDMNGRWLPVASSLAQPVVERILLHLQGMGSMPAEAFDVDIVDDKLSVHMTKIGEDDGNVAVAMLGRSIDEATAEYSRLEHWLLGLTVAGMVVCVVASVLTAKRIAQPLRQLADTAKMLEQGEY